MVRALTLCNWNLLTLIPTASVTEAKGMPADRNYINHKKIKANNGMAVLIWAEH